MCVAAETAAGGGRQRRTSRPTVTVGAVRHLWDQLHLRTTLLESAASGSEPAARPVMGVRT